MIITRSGDAIRAVRRYNAACSTQPPEGMRKIVLKYGLIGGAILAGSMLLVMPFHEQIGFDKGMIIGYTSMVIAFLMIFFGVKSYRDNVAGGSVTFGRSLVVGLLIMLVASVCYVIAWEIVYYLMLPDFADQYTAYAMEKARAAGATEAQLAAQLKEAEQFKEMYNNPLYNIAFTFLEPLPVGLLFSLVTAGVLSWGRKWTE